MIGTIVFAVVAVIVAVMLIVATIKGRKGSFAPTDESDMVRRVMITMSAEKALEFSGLLNRAVEEVRNKKLDSGVSSAIAHVSDHNGRGPCLLEVFVKKV